MTLNWSDNEIQTYQGQVFTTEKFSLDKIRKRIRLLTGVPDLIINQFIHDIVADFCEETWLLRKLIQVGEATATTDNNSQYYQVTIDLTDYADGLLVHDISEISVNRHWHYVTKEAYLGDPTGYEGTETSSGAYITPDTYIGPATYIGGIQINKGELINNYHYEIVNDTTIKIWPVKLTDVVLIPIIFKTSDVATEIPYLLEDYYKEIASGIIADIRIMPRHQAEDAAYHAMNYKKGISDGKKMYSRQYKGQIIRNTQFAL